MVRSLADRTVQPSQEPPEERRVLLGVEARVEILDEEEPVLRPLLPAGRIEREHGVKESRLVGLPRSRRPREGEGLLRAVLLFAVLEVQREPRLRDPKPGSSWQLYDYPHIIPDVIVLKQTATSF